jgi:hypothetical protein
MQKPLKRKTERNIVCTYGVLCVELPGPLHEGPISQGDFSQGYRGVEVEERSWERVLVQRVRDDLVLPAQIGLHSAQSCGN